MFKDLNPRSFGGELRFIWLSSSEGAGAQDALLMSGFEDELRDSEKAHVQAVVAQTLRRIGHERFRRHLEIKPLMSHPELHLFEMRWQFAFRDVVKNLRLYITVNREESAVVGLCFREKRIVLDANSTFLNQQADIQRASELAEIYWQGKEMKKQDGRNHV